MIGVSASSRQLGWTLLWASGVSLLALAASITNPVLLILAVPLWGISALRIERPELARTRKAALGVLAALVFALLLIALSVDPRNFIEYFSIGIGGLVLIKLYDTTSARDRATLFCMTTSLVVGAALLKSSFAIGLIATVYFVLALRAAALLQIALVEERSGLHEQRPRWRQARPGVALSAGLSVAVMVVVFVLMPRGFMAAPDALSTGMQGPRDVSGFSPEVRLSRSGGITESYEPLMRVEFLEGHTAMVHTDRVYLRGSVNDEYKDEQFRTSPERRWRPLPLRIGRAELLGGDDAPLVRARVSYIRDDRENYLFTFGRPRAVQLERPLGATLVWDPGTATVAVERGGFRSYVVEADPIWRAESPGDPMPSFEAPERVREYAMSLLRGQDIERDPSARHTPNDEQIVRLFERRLGEICSYTTDPGDPAPGEDPIEAFLFSHNRGHCELFASALAGLARSVGIEARVVTGFLTTEKLSDTEFLVRDAHAHAWVEAHVEPGFWLRFDASPPGDVAQAHTPPSGPIVTLRRAWQWASDLWVRSVISYDSASQRELLGDQYEAALDRASSKRIGTGSFGGIRGVLRAAGLGLAAGALVVIIGLAIDAVRGRQRGGGARGGEGRLWIRRADRALARAGWPRPPYLPLRSHAQAMSRDIPEIARAYDELARMRYEARFGRHGDHVFKEAFARLRSALGDAKS